MEPRSVRLNYSNRKNFINTAVQTLIPANTRPSLDNFYRAKRDTIYDYIYGPFKDLMRQLPDWAKTKTKVITVKLEEEVIRFTLAKEEFAFEDGTQVVKPFVPICSLDKYDPLTQEYLAFKQQIIDWDTKRFALKKELEKVVKACNTSSQLYQAWPKSLDFARCFPYKGSKVTPKVRISSAALDITMGIVKSTVGQTEEN